ncbi:MAG: OmpA family protein [Chitinophagaceae bacterium]|nr:OmpA family protein [Chitinophagaceae bacterium]
MIITLKRKFFLNPGSLFALYIFLSASANAQNLDTLFVQFDFNKSILTDKGKHSIDSFFSKVMQTSFIKNIHLTGHCDSIGDNGYNDTLSVMRVLAIKDYLYLKGATDKLITQQIGWGKRKPLFDNSTEENRWLNRRVEVVISSIPKVRPSPTSAPASPPEKQTAAVTKASPKKAPSRPKEFDTIYDFVKDSETKTGDSIVLKNLNFIGGRHFPIASSFKILEELLQVMRNIPTLKIEIQGHICCEVNGEDAVDVDAGTRDLSIQRAKFVYDYLKGYGIGADRMQYKGFGSRRKLFGEELNEAQQLANRRVEIKILSK